MNHSIGSSKKVSVESRQHYQTISQLISDLKKNMKMCFTEENFPVLRGEEMK